MQCNAIVTQLFIQILQVQRIVKLDDDENQKCYYEPNKPYENLKGIIG